MYQLLERAITDDERKRLLDSRPLQASPIRALRKDLLLRSLSELVGLALASAYAIWLQKLPVSLVLPLGLLGYAFYWALKFKNRMVEPLRKHREANQKIVEFQDAVNALRTVRVHHVEADGVVEVLHDEGTICLFDVGGKQTYWIDPYCGMIPGPPAPKGWPNSKFEVLEAADWKEQLGPFCYGKRLRPRENLEFRDYFEEFDFDKVPAGGLIEKPVDLFLQEARAESLANLAAIRRNEGRLDN
jgi:hypothetical protein